MDKFIEIKPSETNFVAISTAPFIGYQAANVNRNSKYYAKLSGIPRNPQTIGPGLYEATKNETFSFNTVFAMKPIVALDSISREIYENKLMLRSNFGLKSKL